MTEDSAALTKSEINERRAARLAAVQALYQIEASQNHQLI